MVNTISTPIYVTIKFLFPSSNTSSLSHTLDGAISRARLPSSTQVSYSHQVDLALLDGPGTPTLHTTQSTSRLQVWRTDSVLVLGVVGTLKWTTARIPTPVSGGGFRLLVLVVSLPIQEDLLILVGSVSSLPSPFRSMVSSELNWCIYRSTLQKTIVVFVTEYLFANQYLFIFLTLKTHRFSTII